MKNIIIITNNYDESVDSVIDWINYKGKNVTRLNSEDLINYENLFGFEINKLSNFFKIKSNFPCKNICSVWIRKGSAINPFNLNFIKDENLRRQISNHLFSEINETKISFVNFLENNYFTLGTIPTNKLDKISQLQMAKDAGFNIPATIVTNSKDEIKKFKRKYKTIIAKCIKDSTFIRFNDASYGQYTEIVPDYLIEQLPDYFIPNIVQECLDKDYDIRCFYLNGEIYSMAVITANDIENNIDFRKNYTKDNIRYVPFKLPNIIKRKLIVFMKNIKLNTGSIDIVKTKNNQYFFIEVNPTGQFGMVSLPCNYYLEEKIANLLCEKK